jgi:hypothetical protein
MYIKTNKLIISKYKLTIFMKDINNFVFHIKIFYNLLKK